MGEYWSADTGALCEFSDRSGQVMSLFDVPLHQRFFEASEQGAAFDMSGLARDTLSERQPDLAVTFVDNHDTQPGQALQSWVREWFKPLAYAMILLRESGVPCVFYGDLYGIPHDGIGPTPGLETLLMARQKYALGRQTSYFDRPDVVGWTRSGEPDVPGSGLAAVMSGGEGGARLMCVGARHAGETFVDILGGRPERVTLDGTGSAEFPVDGGAVSVWVTEAAA